MSAPKLTVVSTCSNQKRGPIASERCLRKWNGLDAPTAARRWVASLRETPATAEARDIYVGSHWLESMKCYETARSRFRDADFQVLSAGYGLISHRTAISNYAASFAAGTDSIQNLKWPASATTRERQASWWGLLCRAWGRSGLVEHFQQYPKAHIIVVILSREYFGAVEKELAELISQGRQLYIVSAGVFANLSTASPIVRTRVLPFNDRFKAIDPYLDKTNTSLNARLANWLLTEHADHLADGNGTLFDLIRDVGAGLPDPVRKQVMPMTDEEVLVYIQDHYPKYGTTATPLLRHLRDSKGLSCEQKRFGALFHRFKESQQGQLFELR